VLFAEQSGEEAASQIKTFEEQGLELAHLG
jgi:hypothetical protein